MNRWRLITLVIVLGIVLLVALLIPEKHSEVPEISNTDMVETFNSKKELKEEKEEEAINAYTWSSEDEHDLIIRTVITEARGESIIGQMAVAQCIRDAAEYYNITPTKVLNKLHYAKPYTVSNSSLDQQYYEIAKQAVDRVFNEGARAIYSRVIYFYAPNRIYSKFHESQTYVCTIGNHKFFDIKESEG